LVLLLKKKLYKYGIYFFNQQTVLADVIEAENTEKIHTTMKKKFILIGLTLMLGFSSTSFTQTLEKKDGGIAIGPKGGLSINRLRGNDAVRTQDRTGVVIGGFINISFLRLLSVQPELFFSQRGGGANISNTSTSNLKLSYMELPILFKLRLPLGRTFFPHVFAGPDFAYRVYSKSTNTDNNTGTTTEIDNDRIRRMANGGVFGAGLDIQGKHCFYTIDGRYGFTFNDLGKSTYRLDVRNRNVTILVGIGFRFGGIK
jgi:hypothetical protein